MKMSFSKVLMIAALILLSPPSFGHAASDDPATKRLLLVHSYHREWGWNQDSKKGLIDGLERAGYVLGANLRIIEFYMDTKRTHTTPEQIKQRAQEAWLTIKDFKPDLVYVNDDNALKYVAVPYPDSSVPFVFAGVNTDPEKSYPQKIASLEKPGHNITGVLERFPYEHSFSLTQRIMPGRNKILIISDKSPSGDFVNRAFKTRYLDKVKSPQMKVLGNLQFKTFKEWKETVLAYQDKADIFGILTYHQLLDEQGKVVPSGKVAEWMVKNSKVPEIGFLMFHAEDFCLSVVGVSPYKTNRHLGNVAAKILKGELKPGDVAIIDAGKIDIAFNLKRANTLSIEIPFDLLGIATDVFKDFGQRW